MPNQFIIALFQPTDSTWAADVYLPNAVGEKGERIFCSAGYFMADAALRAAGQFVAHSYLRQLA